MDPEKIPLLSTSEDTIWDEKDNVSNTQKSCPEPAPECPQETVLNEDREFDILPLPILLPLKTQVLYWIASASVLACGEIIHRVVAQHHLVGPVLLFTVAACLVAITGMDIRGRPWSTTRTSRTFVIGFAMLSASELAWPLRLINDWSHSSVPRLIVSSTIWQQHAIRFCFAFVVLEFLDRRTKIESYVMFPNDGSRASVWCAPPYFSHLVGRAIWKRRDKMRGVCHCALAWSIASVLARLVAYVLRVPPTAVWYSFWGSGCLGSTNAPSEIFLLRPMHALVFWLCDRILYAFGKLVDQWGARRY